MANRVRVRRNFPPLTKLELVDHALMQEVGKLIVTMVRRRTLKGLDADGRAFKPLSPGYAKQKREALGSTRADLSVSGRMLNELRIVVVKRNEVGVGYLAGGTGRASGGTFIQRSRSVSGAEKANYHANTGAGKSRIKRDFLGLTKDEQAKVERAIQKHVEKKLKAKR